MFYQQYRSGLFQDCGDIHFIIVSSNAQGAQCEAIAYIDVCAETRRPRVSTPDWRFGEGHRLLWKCDTLHKPTRLLFLPLSLLVVAVSPLCSMYEDRCFGVCAGEEILGTLAMPDRSVVPTTKVGCTPSCHQGRVV